MKITFTFLLFFSSITLFNSQNLNLKMIEQIAEISFWSIDDLMITGYGFKEMDNDEKGTKKYGKIPNGDRDNFISIVVRNNPISPSRTVELLVGPNYSIENFKNDLIENNYLYKGKYIGEESVPTFLKYEKDNASVIVTEEPNAAGANRIMMAIN